MGLLYSTYLDHPQQRERHITTYTCNRCRTHLLMSNYILSSDFSGRTGDAFLVKYVVNVTEGELQRRKMTTGVYEVRNITCHQCNNLVGWRYVHAELPQQKYKEGNYILEINCMYANGPES
ncbi:hypothetical protein BABINDRAFT_39685 [Babjeviella inositovora NRRL Y-12698]|uniref:Protein yippee-like n=1 Tax=Babjeviella inositovora NRRL Y-12698 TaxID=984486 RepID=A0A1E3QL00_9ASCO|nr:uncharacterized protein BABINDRAFT_39685 [Babjeviella inositovora NRRL Y-12698]ODQ78379.1 hypothetical protein BABINDRAFT_39685 [Babjeviella inositovora NRRL Y-12698]